jgi:thioredoxin-like negative regulator of GroEL
MREVRQLSQLIDAIYSTKAVAVLFTREDSADSMDLAPRVRRLFRRVPGIPLYHVSIDEHPTAANEFLVYKVPTLTVYYNGTPSLKRVGGFHLPDLRADLEEFAARM